MGWDVFGEQVRLKEEMRDPEMWIELIADIHLLMLFGQSLIIICYPVGTNVYLYILSKIIKQPVS
jgi:hypothetical protein